MFPRHYASSTTHLGSLGQHTMQQPSNTQVLPSSQTGSLMARSLHGPTLPIRLHDAQYPFTRSLPRLSVKMQSSTVRCHTSVYAVSIAWGLSRADFNAFKDSVSQSRPLQTTSKLINRSRLQSSSTISSSTSKGRSQVHNLALFMDKRRRRKMPEQLT